MPYEQQHQTPPPTSPPSRLHTPGAITLLNFNEHAQECTINSPRSLAAMKRLGISGRELLFKPPSHRSFSDGVDQQTAELVGDYVQKRFNHYEHKRQAKVAALREEREAMIQAGQGGQLTLYSGGGAHHGAESALVAQARDRASTALEMEREEIARMQQRLLTKLNNTLAFEIRRAQTLDRAQAKVDYATQRAEAEKAYRAQLQAEAAEQQKRHVVETQRRLAQEAEERRRAADEAWRQTQQEKHEKMEAEKERRRREREAQVDHRNRSEEKRQQLEAIQEMQQRAIAEKEARLQEKENERLRAQEESRRMLQDYNEQQREAARQKLELAAQRAQQSLEEKRNRYLDKEQLAEQKRREFEAARDWERAEARRRAKEKEALIKQTQAQADWILQQKAATTMQKSQETAERLAERERIRAMDEHERKKWLQDREEHRKQILNQSYWQREERAQQILQKRAQLNSRSNQALRQRNQEIKERKLQERLLEQDRKEQVERMARVKQNQREELLARIQADRERIDMLQQQSQALAQQRLKLRDMAEKQQATILDQFEKLKAHPEKLRNLDPNNVDVVKLGFLSQQDVAALMSFNLPNQRRSASVTPTRGVGQGMKRSNSAGRFRKSSFDQNQTPIMDRPLPRPQTQQVGRSSQQQQPTDLGQPSQEYLQYAESLATH